MKLWTDAGPGHGGWRVMHRRHIAPVEGGDTYLVRYIPLGTPWGSVMVHKILREDQARDFHDHPWSFVSVILKGQYTEELPGIQAGPGLRHMATPVGRRFRRRGPLGRWAWMRSTDCHLIADIHGAPVWSLVITGPRRRVWGFWDEAPAEAPRWVDWRTYCGVPQEVTA